MLHWTGHPLLDVGVAAILALQGKRTPESLTEDDLAAVATFIEREYVRPPLKAFLTVAFTSNSWFAQDAFNPDKPGLSEAERSERAAKRALWAARHLWQWRAEGTAEQDVFTGEAALPVELSGSLPPSRAGRAQIPLLLGDVMINFYPNGAPGLPVSGKTLLCLQAFPLGCAKVAGKLLAVHSDNPALLLHFARRFLAQNRKTILLAREQGSRKMPESPLTERTLLIQTLLDAEEERRAARQEGAASLTAYHLTNSGQGVELRLYHLPLQVIAFLREMYAAPYHATWQGIVARGWEVAPAEGKREGQGSWQPRRNWLFEDLWQLPATARHFLRLYLLRAALQQARAVAGDPRPCHSLREEAHLVSWPITACFLERIMNMNRERVAQIRTFADQVTAYVQQENDRRLFRQLLLVRHYDQLRALLIRLNLAHVQRGHAPFLTFDTYLTVFEEGEEIARSDWRLVRDLVLIRMVEQLHSTGWLARHIEEIPQLDEDADPTL